MPATVEIPDFVGSCRWPMPIRWLLFIPASLVTFLIGNLAVGLINYFFYEASHHLVDFVKMLISPMILAWGGLWMLPRWHYGYAVFCCAIWFACSVWMIYYGGFGLSNVINASGGMIGSVASAVTFSQWFAKPKVVASPVIQEPVPIIDEEYR